MSKRNLYSGFFFERNGVQRHATYMFGKECSLPDGIKEGDKVTIKVVGTYEDSNVECLIVDVQVTPTRAIFKQPSGTLMHVTTWTDGDTSPVESGKRATENGYKPKDGEMYIATAGYFKV